MKREELAHGKHLANLGECWEALGGFCSRQDVTGVTWVKMTIRMTPEHPDGFFVVVKGHAGAEEVVAFYGGYSWNDLLIGLARRGRGKGLKWREDKPWDGR